MADGGWRTADSGERVAESGRPEAQSGLPSFQSSAHPSQKRSQLAIGGLGPPGDAAHEDHDLLVEYSVDNAIPSDADPVEVILEVNATVRTRLVAKRAHGFDHALSFGTG